MHGITLRAGTLSRTWCVIALASTYFPAVLAASGKLSFLAFNVAGLPAIINSNGVPGDKEENSAQIGRYFAEYGFDIINIQEDFNYHEALYANDDHPYRTVTSGPVVVGSGLNTLSNYEFSGLDRVTWDDCFIGSGDCLTPKGFSFMRVKMAEGTTIDVYNLHADAGNQDGDLVARRSNIEQISDYIDAHSAGQAVIVGGDTNTRYTRAEDNIRLLSTRNNLTDAWVLLAKNGSAPEAGSPAQLCENPSRTTSCETVDKVFFRSGGEVTLQAIDFAYAGVRFLQEDGSILSDHDPVLVNFAWSTASSGNGPSTCRKRK